MLLRTQTSCCWLLTALTLFFLSAVYRDRDCLAVGEEPPPTAGFIQQHIPAVLSAEPDCVLPALNASVEPRQEEEGGGQSSSPYGEIFPDQILLLNKQTLAII